MQTNKPTDSNETPKSNFSLTKIEDLPKKAKTQEVASDTNLEAKLALENFTSEHSPYFFKNALELGLDENEEMIKMRNNLIQKIKEWKEYESLYSEHQDLYAEPESLNTEEESFYGEYQRLKSEYESSHLEYENLITSTKTADGLVLSWIQALINLEGGNFKKGNINFWTYFDEILKSLELDDSDKAGKIFDKMIEIEKEICDKK